MALHDYKRKRQFGKPSYAPSEVWYALDSRGRPVVVKLLKSKLAADLQRFIHEADCAEKLVSPHVAQVWESGVEPEPYIVFEYVHGVDLGKVAPLRNFWEYLKTAEAIVAGLAAIHEQGIAHRDIKPDNVRYERDGHAKIVDLGIALTTTKTGDRQTVVPPGTAGWMAPERRQGQLLDVAEEQKADMFSVGLLLAYLRTGMHPFDYDQRTIDNPLEQPNLAQLDSDLRDLIYKTLNRDPTQRPEARDLLRELRRLARHLPTSPQLRLRRAGKSIRIFTTLHRGAIAAFSLFLIAILTLSWIYVVPSVHSAPGPLSAQPEASICHVGQYPRNSGDAVLKYGALLPISGPLTAQGPQLFAAIELALNEVRSAQGVPGIQIVPLDGINKVDEGDPVANTACQSANTLLTNRVDVIIGPAASAVTYKVIDTVASSGTILFSPSNTAPELTNYDDKGLYFRTAASDALQGRVLAKVIAEDNNKNVLIVARDDLYGHGLGQEVQRSLQLSHINLLPTLKYDLHTMSFDSLAQKVASQHPDGIVLIGFDETAKVLASLRSVDITPQNRKIYGTEGNMRETIPGQVDPSKRDVLSGMTGTTRPAIDPNFAKRLNQSAGGGLADFTYAAEVYDAVIVSALAAASAHSDNPRRIADKINDVTRGGQKCTKYADCLNALNRGIDIDYDGVSGPLEFNDAGEPCTASYLVVKFDENGSLVPKRTVEASNLCINFR
jgi:ABC-type branched-subunit amino acid transport system substrate-binding protein